MRFHKVFQISIDTLFPYVDLCLRLLTAQRELISYNEDGWRDDCLLDLLSSESTKYFDSPRMSKKNIVHVFFFISIIGFYSTLRSRWERFMFLGRKLSVSDVSNWFFSVHT